MKIAICPGSFDPVTLGHLDIISRSCKLFDKVIVAVLVNPEKKTLFTVEERMELLRRCTKNLPGVEVGSFYGLLADYAKEQHATAVVRGLRALSDFEYELQMALMNKKLNENLETVFLMTSVENSFVSSTIIKQVSALGGCIQGLVPDEVAKKLNEKYKVAKNCT